MSEDDRDLPPLSEPPRTAYQCWMSRLAFSFVIVAAVLIWKAGTDDSLPRSRQILCIVGAIACAILAALGIRERHRSGGSGS